MKTDAVGYQITDGSDLENNKTPYCFVPSPGQRSALEKSKRKKKCQK